MKRILLLLLLTTGVLLCYSQRFLEFTPFIPKGAQADSLLRDSCVLEIGSNFRVTRFFRDTTISYDLIGLMGNELDDEGRYFAIEMYATDPSGDSIRVTLITTSDENAYLFLGIKETRSLYSMTKITDIE